MAQGGNSGSGKCGCPKRSGTPTGGDEREGTPTPPDRPGTPTPREPVPEGPRPGTPTGPRDLQGRSGKAPCYCLCECVDETTATLAGVFPSEPYANPVLSVGEGG